MKVGINGFGRIGRLILRAILESQNKELQIVAINDLGDLEQNIHLLKYDSVHGNLETNLKRSNEKLIAGDNEISFYKYMSPIDIPWHKDKVDIVFRMYWFLLQTLIKQ